MGSSQKLTGFGQKQPFSRRRSLAKYPFRRVDTVLMTVYQKYRHLQKLTGSEAKYPFRGRPSHVKLLTSPVSIASRRAFIEYRLKSKELTQSEANYPFHGRLSQTKHIFLRYHTRLKVQLSNIGSNQRLDRIRSKVPFSPASLPSRRTLIGNTVKFEKMTESE